MIAYGKILLQKSRIGRQEIKIFSELNIDAKADHIPPYSYDSTIQVMSTLKLEQQIMLLDEKNKVMHALANIEYNAMKSYIDTIVRFIHDVPKNYQTQFRSELSLIASEELQHFQLADELCKYGSQPIHNNLLKRMMQTNDSLLGRIAVLSIVNEGRGMDTGSNLIAKVDGDLKYKQVIKNIVSEESNHVRTGLKWFEILCGKNNPQQQFLLLMKNYDIHRNWKINIQKRKQVGFTDEWIKCLQQWD